MIKASLSGAAVAALLTSSAAAAPAPEAPAWVVAPQAEACRTEFELTGAAGASVAAALVSDGDHLALRFSRGDLPEQAFLPIRIDHKPYANLVLRAADGQAAEMQLSPETLAALRRGSLLQVGWLAQEVVSASLSGSEQALADLRTCGAQVAGRFRAQQAAAREAQARAEAEARARTLADEQLAAVRAQREAAEAETRRDAAEAERLRAVAESERQRAAQQAEASAPPGPYDTAPPDPRYAAPEPAYPPPYPYRRW